MGQTCVQCGETKPDENFYQRDGKPRSECKPCVVARSARNRLRRTQGRPTPRAQATMTQAEYMKARREPRLAAARARLGGACAWCGTTADLEFDHVDPNSKHREVTVLAAGREDLFWAEVDKCQLLCAHHHQLKSKFERILTKPLPAHGGIRRYGPTYGCRCDECRQGAFERNQATGLARATAAGRGYKPYGPHRT